MPGSFPARLQTRRFAAASRGFTLIEILVMMLIIGIAASVVMLSVGSGSRPDQLRADAEQLAGMMQLALEEAVLSNKPIGLRFTEEFDSEGTQTSYEWASYLERQWEPLADHSYFSQRQFTAGTEVELRLEGRLSLLGGDEKRAGLQLGLPAEGVDDSDKEQEGLQSSKAYTPDVFFLHSGEISPAFELLIRAENIAAEYQIEANPIGQIRLLRRNDPESEWL